MKIKKTETVEEFLARGGEIIVVPPQEQEETKNVIKSTVGGLPQLMTLSDGAHFFGETRKKRKKPVTNEEFKDKVTNLNLPSEIVSSLMRSIGDKNDK